jgi:hypothetical protein
MKPCFFYSVRFVWKLFENFNKSLCFRYRALCGIRHAVAQWLRHCATNRKVAGWIPDGVIGFFH